MNREDYQRSILMELLEQNGISLDDLPEPLPPTDEEVQRLVKDLLDEGKAQEQRLVLWHRPLSHAALLKLGQSQFSRDRMLATFGRFPRERNSDVLAFRIDETNADVLDLS